MNGFFIFMFIATLIFFSNISVSIFSQAHLAQEFGQGVLHGFAATSTKQQQSRDSRPASSTRTKKKSSKSQKQKGCPPTQVKVQELAFVHVRRAQEPQGHIWRHCGLGRGRRRGRRRRERRGGGGLRWIPPKTSRGAGRARTTSSSLSKMRGGSVNNASSSSAIASRGRSKKTRNSVATQFDHMIRVT